MFRTSLAIGNAVAFIGFLISSNTANADTYTGCLTHYGFLVKVQEGPDPKRPCSSRRRETEITFKFNDIMNVATLGIQPAFEFESIGKEESVQQWSVVEREGLF